MIEGENIRLRVIERSDLETIRSWYNDPDLRGMSDISAPLTVLQMERKYDEWQKEKDSLRFLIESKKKSELMGMILIHTAYRYLDFIIPVQDDEHREAVLESLGISVKLLFFEIYNQHRVQVWIPSWNDWMISIVREFGMHSGGQLRRTGMRTGAFFDHVLFELLRDEWDII